MKVSLITAQRPFENFCGGEEKFTVSFGKWLAEQGNDVTILGRTLFGVATINSNCSRSTEPEKELIQTRRLRLPQLIYTIALSATSLMFVLKIAEINRKSRLTILHAQDTGYGGLGSVIAAKLLGLPVIISSHGLRYITLKSNLKGFSKACLPFEFFVDVFVSRRVDLLLVVSRSHKAFFCQMGVEREKIVAIPVGVKTSEFKTIEEERKSMRKKLGIQQEILLGFVGRLSPEKNLFSLLEAFAGSSEQSSNIKLMIVGTGHLADKLKISCKNQGLLNKTVFTGARTDIRELLSAIDIFVLPSYTEGCPIALLEAMSSGKAIIASDIPSIREIVRHGEEAILINPHSVENLKQAILLLYNNPNLRAKLGQRANEKAKLYVVDKIYGRILKKFEELVRCKEK